jgi:hypothetical protein
VTYLTGRAVWLCGRYTDYVIKDENVICLFGFTGIDIPAPRGETRRPYIRPSYRAEAGCTACTVSAHTVP